jgi:hypothetical protein
MNTNEIPDNIIQRFLLDLKIRFSLYNKIFL